jgi:hypothetical protein
MHRPEPRCWLHPDVAVAPSDVAGRGLVATRPIAAGTVVSVLGCRLVDDGELAALFEASETYVDTVVVAEGTHLVLPPGSPNRFGNHGCEPNLGWADEYSLETLRDVVEGEELLHDYAMSTVDPGFYLRCHCPSARCRHKVPALPARSCSPRRGCRTSCSNISTAVRTTR